MGDRGKNNTWDTGVQASDAPDTAGLARDFAMEETCNDPSLKADVAAFLRNKNSPVDSRNKSSSNEQATALCAAR